MSVKKKIKNILKEEMDLKTVSIPLLDKFYELVAYTNKEIYDEELEGVVSFEIEKGLMKINVIFPFYNIGIAVRFIDPKVLKVAVYSLSQPIKYHLPVVTVNSFDEIFLVIRGMKPKTKEAKSFLEMYNEWFTPPHLN